MLRGQVLHTTLNRFYASLPRELDSERVTPENLEAAIELMRRCLDDAIESGVRLESHRASGAGAPAHASIGSRGFPAGRGRFRGRVRPAPARGRFRLRASSARAAARPPARRRPLALREDRPDRHRPVQRSRDRPGLQVRQGRALRPRHRSRASAPDPALHPRAARSRRRRAARGRLPGTRGPAADAWNAPGERPRRPTGVREGRLPRRGDVLEPGRVGAGAGSGERNPDPGGGRTP